MTWDPDAPRFRDAWETRQEFARGGDSLRPVVGGGDATINVSAINLVSPNAPAAVVSCTPSSFGPLANNSTILNPGGTPYYWISGDALWFKFAQPVSGDLLPNAIRSLSPNVIPVIQAYLKGLNLSVVNQSITAFFAQPTASLFFQALYVNWDPTTLCWNNQPYNEDTQTDSTGHKFITDPASLSVVLAARAATNMKAADTFNLSGLQSTDALERATIQTVANLYQNSGPLLAGTTTTVRIDQLPFQSGGSQVLYKTAWNQNNSFIGMPIVIIPYALDVTRTPQNAIITGYSAVDGTITFTPALPWTPAIGDATHTDQATMYTNVFYGAALRLYASSAPLGDDPQALFTASCAPFTGIQFFREALLPF